MRLLERLSRHRTWRGAPIFALNRLKFSRKIYKRTANEAWIRSLCRSIQLDAETSLCTVLGRFKMFVETSDYSISAHLRLDGYWEMWLTEAIVAVTRQGMIAVDIGANVGYFSLVMADLVGPNGRVYAFEANAPIAEHARKSAKINGYADTLNVYTQALGDFDGETFTLVVPPGQPGGTYLVPVSESDPPENAVVTRRLDGYPELLDADVIKIDVEGAEEAVWRGMEGILARGRSLTIFLEFVSIRYCDPRAFLEEICSWGFSISLLHVAHGIVPVTFDQILSWPAGQDQLLVLRR